jgi:hypothetical protein
MPAATPMPLPTTTLAQPTPNALRSSTSAATNDSTVNEDVNADINEDYDG